jgi:hypothetical protein
MTRARTAPFRWGVTVTSHFCRFGFVIPVVVQVAVLAAWSEAVPAMLTRTLAARSEA